MRACLLFVLAVAACGSKTHAPKILHIDIRGMAYVPDSLAVSLGDTVEWTNNDLVPHSVTSSSFDSKAIPPHQTWSYVAKAPGDFAYNCTFHTMMVGAIIVR
ncbi:MAG TPA: cupredoxin domain-containing protein [Kofleriaceae bacterium]|nr:cupredoxin domain-containing protein [Kofleriaceae bacterium]